MLQQIPILQLIAYLSPWLITSAILIIPLLCFLLYKRRRFRTCLIFSHIWCMIAFCLLGLFISHTVRHYTEREYNSDKARKLLEMVKILREGDTQEVITRLDDFMAGTLYQTAYDVPDDKMAELDPYTLWVWQEVKEYYDTYKVKEPAYSRTISRVRGKLAHVPFSDMQLAIKKFEQTYRSGERALAPAIKMESWLGPAVADEFLKDKVILLDFWNIHCVPCVKSLPELQKIYDTYKDRGLVVIACAGGKQKETKEFLDKNGYHFPAGMHSYQMYLDYVVRSNPSYFIIDRYGYLVSGPENRLPTADELSSLLKKDQ
jgi:thiol-disulfide isomerase/thioredoxin